MDKVPIHIGNAKPGQSWLHLAKSVGKILARDDMVEEDTAVVPPRYHFLITSTTCPLSTTYFESSFPSKGTTIYTQTHRKEYPSVKAQNGNC